MKKIYLISYGDYDYDGRLRCLIDVFAGMGELHTYTRGSKLQNENYQVHDSSSGYLSFIRKAVKKGKKLKGIDYLVLDNRKATIPGLLLKWFSRPKLIIQDCRELYVKKDVKHLSGKIGCFFEKAAIKRSDIVICANEERADIMQKMYKLKKRPLVFENLRKLEYQSEQGRLAAQEKFASCIKEGEYRILSSAGCTISRTTDVLVENLDKVEKPCRLLLAGDAPKEDEKKIREIIAEHKLQNVEILGRLNQDELKYLIEMSHIGIVNYHQLDTNNKYCASGKLYEFIYEGVPVVTTTNPPLKRLCDAEGIGVSSDAYYPAVNTILNDYELYKQNAVAFANTHSVDQNNRDLIAALNGAIAVALKEKG